MAVGLQCVLRSARAKKKTGIQQFQNETDISSASFKEKHETQE